MEGEERRRRRMMGRREWRRSRAAGRARMLYLGFGVNGCRGNNNCGGGGI